MSKDTSQEFSRESVINTVIQKTGVNQIHPLEDEIIGCDKIREEILYTLEITNPDATLSPDHYREAVLQVIGEKALDRKVQEESLLELAKTTKDPILFKATIEAIQKLGDTPFHSLFHAVFEEGDKNKILIILTLDLDDICRIDDSMLDRLESFLTHDEATESEKAAVFHFLDHCNDPTDGLKNLYKTHSKIADEALILLRARHHIETVVSAICAIIPNAREDLIGELVSELAQIIDDKSLSNDLYSTTIFIYHACQGFPKNKRIKEAIQVLAQNDKDVFLDSDMTGLFLEIYTDELERIAREKNRIELDDVIQLPSSRAIIKFVRKDRAKADLFEKAADYHAEALENPQAWISINSPKEAEDLFEAVLAALPSSKKDKVMKNISQKLGRNVKTLDEKDFKYYPDEIIDGLILYVRQDKGLRSNALIQEKIATLKFVDELQVRFIKRTESDLNLGDRCGDCSARGSINFENALSWYVNPNYQIMTMQHGKRFIGRLNITIGTIAGEKTLLIDATEFNPQTQRIPRYREYGKTCLEAATEHLLRVAKSEGAKLVFYTASNSTDFPDEIAALFTDVSSLDHEEESVAVTPYFPSEVVRSVLAENGYHGKLRCFYQALSSTDSLYERIGKDNLSIETEKEVFNPAQIEDEDFAQMMRARDFKKASEYLLTQEIWLKKLIDIFKSTPNATLIQTKMKEAYPDALGQSQESFVTYKIAKGAFLEILEI